MTTPGFQKFEHSVIVSAFFTCQVPGDCIGNVIVADRDRVGIPERRCSDHASGPRANSSDVFDTATDLVWRPILEAGQTRHLPRYSEQDLGPFPFHPERMQVGVPQLSKALGWREN